MIITHEAAIQIADAASIGSETRVLKLTSRNDAHAYCWYIPLVTDDARRQQNSIRNCAAFARCLEVGFSPQSAGAQHPKQCQTHTGNTEGAIAKLITTRRRATWENIDSKPPHITIIVHVVPHTSSYICRVSSRGLPNI